MPYSQNFQNNALQSGFISGPVTSQYRGIQNSFQPAGQVQSFYGQNQQSLGASQSQGAGQFASPQSYHAANYRGNQGFQGIQGISQYRSQQSSQQAQSPQSYHTANYRGNQEGHDQWLRGDASGPNASAYRQQGTYGIAPQSGASSFGQGIAQQFGSNQGFSQFQQQQQQQQQSPQSYHTANYRGNQQDHDAQLRADAVNPSNVQARGFGFN
jgi:hypothetical protein